MKDQYPRGDRASSLLSVTEHSNRELPDKANPGHYTRVTVRNAEQSLAPGLRPSR